MPPSVFRQRMLAEKRQLAGLFIKEVEENLASLSEARLLGSKQYESARGSDRLQLFGDQLQRQLDRVYEKVTTINDALVKYQRFRSSGAGQEDYERKCAEFHQFIGWYRDGLNTALRNLRTRLNEEIREPELPERMTP